MAGFSNRQGRRGGAPQGRPGHTGPPPGPPGPAGPAPQDAPGHTRAFTLGGPTPLAGAADAYGNAHPHGDGHPYGDGPSYDDGRPYSDPRSAYGGNGGAYGEGSGAYGGNDPYAAGGPDGYGNYDNVATYRAGQSAAPPVGPRLHWKQLLSGIVQHPTRTFWQMRDHTMWGPALTVTFVYGLLAVFGFDSARSDVLGTTMATSIPWVLTTGVAVVLCGVTLGAVTNTLARQLGGDGAWAPTIGLAMLITSLTDAPRLLFAMFLGGGNSFVQLLGWLTWLACAALLTRMVATSHDLPWVKALGASSIQLVALLMLFKLPLL